MQALALDSVSSCIPGRPSAASPTRPATLVGGAIAANGMAPDPGSGNFVAAGLAKPRSAVTGRCAAACYSGKWTSSASESSQATILTYYSDEVTFTRASN